jgi:lipid A 3-O-deacylase
MFLRLLPAALLAGMASALLPAAGRADALDYCQSFSILVENDVFTGTDRHYTNGFRASCLSAEGKMPGYGEWLGRNLPMLAENGAKRMGFAIGQNIYTPENISISAPQPADRPWAGWLYGEVSVVSETRERLDTAALSLGVVGPWSGAEFTQRRWHELINVQDPKGWGNQLDNEPALNLTLDRQWRYLALPNLLGLNADITPHVGGAVGNVMTHAAAGATFRFGEDLVDDFGGPPRIRPSLPGAAHFKPHDGFGWYVFAGFEGRAVARNIFLDGNTFGGGPSVDKKPLVGDAQTGVALVFPHFRITYTWVFRTKEFYGQDEGDLFGAVSLTARF